MSDDVSHAAPANPVTMSTAAAFLDIADYQVDPEREMRNAIESLLARHNEGKPDAS